MIKIAVFVEGQTELIFVKDLLLKHFQWQHIEIKCQRLFIDGNIIPANYDYTCHDIQFHYLIIQVGNDKSVLSQILKREKKLQEIGYVRILGLRDMYSKEYRQFSIRIDQAANDRFINGAMRSLKDYSKTSREKENLLKIISIHFSIMEIEAWFLGIFEIFVRMDPKLTIYFIEEKLEYNLEIIDPEITLFHPAKNLNDIYNLINREYDKKEKTVTALMNFIQNDDIEILLTGNKCNSFKSFWKALIPSEDASQ